MVVSKSFLDVVLETDLSLTLEVVSKLFLLEVVSEGYSIYSYRSQHGFFYGKKVCVGIW